MLHSRSTACRWLATLVIFAGGSASARAGFTIADLGVIASTGSSISTPVAINASGAASGTIPIPGGISAAIAQQGGVFQAVSVPSGGSSGMASAINSGGAVAGVYTASNNQTLGFYTSGGSAVPISPLMNKNGVSGSTTQANGINDSGQVVGAGNLPSVTSDRAFIASGGSTTLIAPLGGGNPLTSNLANWANGINNSGTVVGTSELVAGGLQQAFYTGTNNTPISLLTRNAAGDFTSNTYGIAIATYGNIAGYGTVGGSNHAFFASSSGDTLVDMGTLGNASTSYGLAVNDGSLVVGYSGGSAFLWGGSEGMYDLNSLISTADRANWDLTEASGINDNNQIVGEGYLNGVLHGFELTPIAGESLFSPPGVPTPPAVVLSAVGFMMVLGWSRWRRRRSANP